MCKGFVNTFLVLLVLSFFSNAYAQEKYWVFFKDKNTEFNPYEYFHPKAIYRRRKTGVSLYHQSDFPVNNQYIKTVQSKVDSISVVSRWFNCVVVYASPSAISDVEKLPFVDAVKQGGSSSYIAEYSSEAQDNIDWIKLREQVSTLGLPDFESNNIDGKGVLIAVFDAGFPGVDENHVFDHLRLNNQIKKTYDFVKGKEFVYSYMGHGTAVLSCIAGKLGKKNIGLATGADFLLARTEIGHREPFAEEEYWLAAAEWADKNGADIINSSLGYTSHRYETKEMDGNTSFIAKAARMAVRKGILVVNAAGNDGSKKSWEIIGTPADVDSVLSVGGINSTDWYHVGFSSYGPTSNGEMKPNVSAFGEVVAASKSGVKETQGTSFSSPLVAGFAACALQTDTSKTNMELFNEIEKSATLYPYFDYAHGHGVPQANHFVNNREEAHGETFEVRDNEAELEINIFGISSFPKRKYFYYHIEDEKGVLRDYSVIEVSQSNVLNLEKNMLKEGETVRFHYNGYTKEIKF